MEIKKDIISKRYINDGIPLIELNNIQKKYLNLFLNDNRIKYKTISECPLCKSENSILIAEKDRYAIPLETVVCENCGLIRSLRQLDKESAKIFYSEYYRNIYEPLSNNVVNKRYEWGMKKKIPKYITKDKVVLDMGCGGGWNLLSFHKKGYKYYGFDFDKDFIEYGRNKGLNLYLGGAKEAIKMGIKCDYLLLSQVLEVVNNPISFLANLKPLLSEEAIVNIYVASLDLLFWGYAHYDLLRVLQIYNNFLFDEFTLKAIGNIAGYKVINCLGPNLVLENSLNSKEGEILQISDVNKGRKIVDHLKLAEKILCFRKKIGLEKISFKKLYCLIRPVECYKKFAMDYFGKI